MTDPKHLTDEGSDATDLERELLRAAQGARLAPSDKHAIWASVALHCAPVVRPAAPRAPVGSAAAPGVLASKTVSILAPLLKVALIAVGLGGVSAGGYWLSQTHADKTAVVERPQGRSSALSPPSAPSSAPPALPVVPAEQPTSVASASASVAGTSAANREAPVLEKSALRDESAALLEIRRTLRAGDAATALRLLEQARQRFPRGALSQEREALGIEALAKSGAKAAATRKAHAFLHSFPKSPYASDVQTFAGQ